MNTGLIVSEQLVTAATTTTVVLFDIASYIYLNIKSTVLCIIPIFNQSIRKNFIIILLIK